VSCVNQGAWRLEDLVLVVQILDETQTETSQEAANHKVYCPLTYQLRLLRQA